MESLDILTLWKLMAGLGMIAVSGALFQWLQLKLTQRIFIAVCRAILQLSAVGMALGWIFQNSSTSWSCLLMLFMTLVAVITARQRPAWRYKGVAVDLMVGFLCGSWFITTLLICFQEPEMNWNNTQSIIPFFGFLLGNSLTGMSLTMERILSLLSSRRKELEGELALGAERWDVFRPILATSLYAGLTPTINTMTVVGLVSLPGVMTGQVLAGVEPFTAAMNQLSLLLLNAGTTAMSCLSMSGMILNRFFSKQHQISPLLWQDEAHYAAH